MQYPSISYMALEALLMRGKDQPLSESYIGRVGSVMEKHDPGLVVFDEFAFNTEDVIDANETLSSIAQSAKSDIVMAPDEATYQTFSDEELREAFERQKAEANGEYFTFTYDDNTGITLPKETQPDEFIQDHFGRLSEETVVARKQSRPWKETRDALDETGISYETVSEDHMALRRKTANQPPFQTSFDPDTWSPPSVGFYFGSNGSAYAFPKQAPTKGVHFVPGTRLGISICGEMNQVKGEQLKGIDVLANPAREDDDPFIQAKNMVESGNSWEEATSYLQGARDVDERHIRGDSHYAEALEESRDEHGVTVIREDAGAPSSGVLTAPSSVNITEYEVKDAYTRVALA